jgi:hypothetical protein
MTSRDEGATCWMAVYVTGAGAVGTEDIMNNEQFRQTIQSEFLAIRKQSEALTQAIDNITARLEGVWPLIEYPDAVPHPGDPHGECAARIHELESLIRRELPFARVEGRKTWVEDAQGALAKLVPRTGTDSTEGKS